MKSHAELANVIFWDVPFMLAGSKNRHFRESQLLLAEAVATVFTERHLSASDWATLFRDKPESFQVRFGDLTAEGFAFAAAFQRWLTNIDRSAVPRTLESLRASLIRQIDKHDGTSP